MITKESPLEGMNIGTLDTVAIRELPGLHTIDLRVAPGTPTQAAIAKALGFDLPGKTGQTRGAAVSGEAYALCLAPDWWLIVGFQEAEQIRAKLGHWVLSETGDRGICQESRILPLEDERR